MPYTIKPGSFKYKKSNGQFSEIDCFEGPDLTEEVAALEKGKAPIIIDSVTGNPVVIKDGADGLSVEDMKIHFSPIQSGTGDPSPSNIRPISGWNSFILNRTGANVFNANEWIGMGINSTKYSIGENCAITVKESDTSSIGNRLITLIPNTVYAYYVDNNFSDIRVFNSSGSSIESKSTQTFTTPADGKVAIKFYASTYPTTGQFSMVIGSTPPIACIPHVKDFHLITVPALGKNLCPKLIKGIGINANDGSEIQIATFATTDYIPVDFSKDHEYSLSGLEIQLTSYIAAYNAQKQFIGRTSGTQRANDHLNEASFPNGTDKATGDIAFLRIAQYEGSTNKSIDLIDNINVQLEAGSSVTTYEPYINNVIYGGTLDVINRVLTVEWYKTDLANLSWTKIQATGGYYVFYSTDDTANIEDVSCLCDYYKVVSFNDTDNTIRRYSYNGNARIMIRDDSKASMTEAQFAESLSNVNAFLVLATPYEIHLDPVTITTLLGDNTLWSDSNGMIELDYRADTKLFVDQNNPVTDVQVKGTSLVQNGIANIPLAQIATPGLAMVGSGYGLKAANINGSSAGRISIDQATTNYIKGFTEQYRPITPKYLPDAVFQGLARAAGDTTQAASSNTLGTFTPEAIVAIQKMLGVYQAPWELIREDTFTNETEANHVITVDSNGQPLQLTDAILYFESPVQDTYASKGVYGQLWFNDQDDYRYAPECGAWTQGAGDTATHACGAIIEQKDGMLFIGNLATITNTNNNTFRYRYLQGFKNPQHGILLKDNPIIIKTITIPAVTGTGHYIIYGKRKWTT